ncbi:MAG: permease-like cell division protein FtsX [Candidatus Magasanikbacteria bacterium]|nr:permease-like cell division protein FtsX [Candidatus Magasanikbacteria bacterium]
MALGILRIIKFSLQDIARNIGLSFMTVLILILTLLSVNALWSLDILTRQAVLLTKKQVSLSLYLVPDVTDKQVKELEAYLKNIKPVLAVNLVSRSDVLKSFQDRHRLTPEIIEALSELGTNPFGPTIIVQAAEPTDYKMIMDSLNVPEYARVIESKSFAEHEDALERLQNITNRVERVGYSLTVLFAIISFLIIFNTIRVAIYTHRVEISIKRLVGANNWFIRGPYIVESFIFTIISVAATMGLVYLALQWLDPYLSVIFPDNFSLTNYYSSHKLSLFGAQSLAVLILTLVSSSLAMRKELKV